MPPTSRPRAVKVLAVSSEQPARRGTELLAVFVAGAARELVARGLLIVRDGVIIRPD